jgi:hypothetical protein
VRVPTDVTGRRAETLVSGEQLRTRVRKGSVQVDLPAVREHEVVVIS